MYAVFIEIDAGGSDDEDAAAHLQQNVVPRVREAGARAAYWLGELSEKGRRVAFMVFDTEDAARAQLDTLPKVGEAPAGAPAGVTIRNVEVAEVIASL